ncbi:MAG: hypothetical protein WC659_01500 [Patescibacteria group bacterium]
MPIGESIKGMDELSESFYSKFHQTNTLGREKGVAEYPWLFKKAEDLITQSELPKPEKNRVLEELHHLLKLFQETKGDVRELTKDVSDPLEKLITHLEFVGNKLLKENDDSQEQAREQEAIEMFKDSLQEELISPALWQEAQKMGIIPLDTLSNKYGPASYYGGAARNIARLHWNIPIPQGELPVTDLDIIATSGEARVKMQHELHIDPKGIAVSQLSKDIISKRLAEHDVTFNELAVISREGKSTILYAPEAKQSLESGIIHPAPKVRRNFYKTNFVRHPEDPSLIIFLTSITERLIKSVAEGKAEGFKLAEHSLQVPLEKRVLTNVRRFLPKQKERQPTIFWRMSKVFEQMGICTNENFFAHLNAQIEKYPNFNFYPLPQDQVEKANWFVIKIIDLARRKINDPANDVLQLPIYKTLPTAELRKERLIKVPYDDLPDEKFTQNFWQWRQNQRFPPIETPRITM